MKVKDVVESLLMCNQEANVVTVLATGTKYRDIVMVTEERSENEVVLTSYKEEKERTHDAGQRWSKMKEPTRSPTP